LTIFIRAWGDVPPFPPETTISNNKSSRVHAPVEISSCWVLIIDGTFNIRHHNPKLFILQRDYNFPTAGSRIAHLMDGKVRKLK
jgi:hypothetical protein